MSRTVTLQTRTPLFGCNKCGGGCASCSTVILCLISPTLLAPIACPETGETTYPYSTILGTLLNSYQSGDGCQNPIYTYSISYDETLLADPGTPLTAAQVIGGFCENCQTTYFMDLLGDEPYIRNNEDGSQDFISPHGCVYPINNTNGTFDALNTLSTLTINGKVLEAPAAAIQPTVDGAVSLGSETNKFGNVIGRTVRAENLGVKYGVGLRAGTFVANGATEVTVPTTAMSLNCVLCCSIQVVGGTPGAQPYMTALASGIYFKVKAAPGDTSTYNYILLEIY